MNNNGLQMIFNSKAFFQVYSLKQSNHLPSESELLHLDLVIVLTGIVGFFFNFYLETI